jgi:hypothetical protein
MNWFKKLFRSTSSAQQKKDAKEITDNLAEMYGVKATSAKAYFIRIGNAMAHESFDLLSHQSKDGVILVRLLSADYGISERRADSMDTTGQFHAITYHDDMLLKPEPITSVKYAFRALSPSPDSETPIVLVIAKEEWGTNARSWVQTFNAQYIKAGAMPIVRLVICQNATSGATLSSCFDVSIKNPDWENKFARWCASIQMDLNAWNIDITTQAKHAPSAQNLEIHLAVLEASSAGETGRVQAMLKRGADPNVRLREDEVPSTCGQTVRRGFPPLFLAAEGGHADVVKVLLAAGADPNWQSAGNGTALHRAAARGGEAFASVVQALLQAGADPNIDSDNWGTPLRCAANSDNKEVLSLLDAAGARCPRKAIASFCGRCGQSISAVPDWPFHCPACGGMFPNWRPPAGPPRKVDRDALIRLEKLLLEWRAMKNRSDSSHSLEQNRKEIGRIGENIYAVGGMDMMTDTWKALDGSSYISSCWHGIGGWQY